MGTITKTFEIDQMAQRLFTNALPPKWLIRQQNPDVHIDYFVEVVETTEPTGLVFGAQLKGTGSPKYSGKYIKYSYDRKHLAYYLDKVKQPIFLVVIDVNKGIGYWLFAQDILLNSMRSNWRHKTHIEIKIPLNNKLENIDALLKEIRRSDVFMRELWPGSVAAAAKQEEHKLMELDNRFNVNVKFDKGVTCYEFHAKENVSGNIVIRSKADSVDKMNDLIKRGKSVLFEPGEFAITGSKLFDSLTKEFSEHGVRVEAAKTIICESEISVLNPQNDIIHTIHGLNAEMKGGYEEVTVEVILPNSPFSLRFKRGLRLLEKPEKEDITISLNLEKWAGQPLLILSYFEQLYRFAKTIDVGNKIKFSFNFHGNELFHAMTNITEQAFFIKEALPYLEILDNARVISKYFGINPIVPKLESISQNDADSLAMLRTIIETGQHRQSHFGLRTSAVMVVGEESTSLIREGKYPEGMVRIDQPNECAYVFGCQAGKLSLSHIFTNTLLTDESRQKLHNLSDGEDIELEWEGAEGSEHIITRIK